MGMEIDMENWGGGWRFFLCFAFVLSFFFLGEFREGWTVRACS